MNNNVTTIKPLLQGSITVGVQSADGCLVIRPTNSSFANWENIPETVLLNGTFGFILLIMFLIFTHIAWRRTGSDDKIFNQNIIDFLYGYRDPEHWYVIPRYEFLRPQDRHHQHDLTYSYLYIAPKLPLANPIEAFVYESDLGLSDSLKASSEASKSVILSKQQQQQQQDVDLHHSKFQQSPKNLTIKTSGGGGGGSGSAATNLISAKTISKMPKSTTSFGPLHKSTGSKAFGQSFIYPSILTAEQSQASCLSRKLNCIFSTFFKITDADIIYARGIDAYEYLLFQRHLILIMVIANVLCLGVILPIHWFAGTSVDPNIALTTSFQRTTIKNMNANSHFHWAHIICSTIILISSVLIMNSYSASITTKNESQLSRRTLLIGNIPQEQRSRGQLLRILLEYFPQINIEAIQFVYDFSSLYEYESYLSTAIVAKQYCQAYKSKYNREIMIHKSEINQGRYCDGYCRLCSFFYICCIYWPFEERQPGSQYYALEEKYYREKIVKACEKLVKEPTEYAFVTFKTNKQARRVMQELAHFKEEALLEERQQYSRPRSRAATAAADDREAAAVAAAAAAAAVTDNEEGKATKTVQSLDGNNAIVKATSSPEKQANDKTGKGATKFIESGNVDSDPLDPKNNPHIRSIRSPQIINKRRAANAMQKKRRKKRKSFSSSLSSSSSPPSSPPPPPPLPTQQEKSKGLRSANVIRESRLDDGPLFWSVRYAPHPDNVEFDDLRYLARVSKYTGILLHLLMILFFIFITTPNVLLSMIERIAVVRPDRAEELTGFQGLIINYLSILLQIIMTALLPSLITLISKQIPYEDSSSKNHSVMWKVYLFLILMVIVMPSIGMSSAQALFVSDIDPKCLFPTDNGAYFINYVISSTFLSTVLELIKPTDVLYYYFILWTSRSTAEFESGRQFIEREFSVGLQHTSVLLIFSVVITYSISCPLIAPVGLLYLLLKHSVDHYHLYYMYFTKKVDKNMQSTIVIFVKVGLLLMLFQTTVAISLNTGTSYFSLISQIIFWITLAAVAFQFFFDCTSRSLPASAPRRNKFKHEFCACFYLPRVVDNLLKLNAIPQEYISRKL